ncbi:hypothetical protein RDWZM_007817 [Blomia tropicalis]|uniref:Uncharacterized protein n=1 Tax=Blomia tropicalis TaxID=40697 RepID=A0A9Q0LZT6_BLOTA|nr:hypothetical protein RDWZM_007817 [Blomia tropicalis]
MDSVGHYGSYIYNDDHHHFALHFVHEVRKKKKRTDSNCRFHPIVGSGLMVLSEHGFSSMMIIKKKKKKGKLSGNDGDILLKGKWICRMEILKECTEKSPPNDIKDLIFNVFGENYLKKFESVSSFSLELKVAFNELLGFIMVQLSQSCNVNIWPSSTTTTTTTIIKIYKKKKMKTMIRRRHAIIIIEP